MGSYGLQGGVLGSFTGSLELDAAGRYWRMGWQDADTELLESGRQRTRVDRGEGEDFRDTGVDLYRVGGLARIHGFPFDEVRTRPWKLGWVDADINVGVVGQED